MHWGFSGFLKQYCIPFTLLLLVKQSHVVGSEFLMTVRQYPTAASNEK